MLCIEDREDREEMKEYLSFELIQQQPSLFEDGEGSKSDLGKLIKSSVKEGSFNGRHVIVDGGHFLYSSK